MEDAGPRTPEASLLDSRAAADATDGEAPHATDGGPEASAGDAARASVSGQVTVPTALAIDGDTADPARAVVSNDTFSTAQVLTGDVAVGGYLGPAGNHRDTDDVYRVLVGEPGLVTLRIAAATGASAPDLDLALYAESTLLVDDSRGTGSTETVFVPTRGTYFVRVWAPGGEKGLYGLTVGAGLVRGPAAARSRLSSLHDFVPGEALVGVRSTSEPLEALLTRLGLRSLTQSISTSTPRVVRVALPPEPGDAAPSWRTAQRARRLHDAGSTLAAIKALRRSGELTYAEPNYVRTAQAAPPNDPLFPAQWSHAMVGTLDAWDTSLGEAAIVAVVDTGIHGGHADFVNADSSSQLLPGFDMISDPARALDGDGRDSAPEDPGDRAIGEQSTWHGTHLAGVIAAATDDGEGCAGLAPRARILPVRVLGRGGGTTYDIVQGILFAAGLENDTGALPARRADVINLSFAGGGLSQSTADAVAAARSAGVIVVAAAGNDAADAVLYSPAGEPGVVTVGAVDRRESRARYSNFGDVIDVVAPGGDLSADRDGDGTPDGILGPVNPSSGASHQSQEGTSIASAEVAGIVALMKGAYPELSPARFDEMLAGAGSAITRDLGTAGRDAFFGNGLLDARLAVLAAREAAESPRPSTPTLAVSTTTLDFGAVVDTLPLHITNAGSGELLITAITPGAPWVTITPGAAGPNSVTIDRSRLPMGPSAALLEIYTNGGASSVTILATGRSANLPTGGDIGPLHVLLTGPDGRELSRTSAQPAAGYAFVFDDVALLDYTLTAGTDLDGDDAIDEDGEAFGRSTGGAADAGSSTIAVTLTATDTAGRAP